MFVTLTENIGFPLPPGTRVKGRDYLIVQSNGTVICPYDRGDWSAKLGWSEKDHSYVLEIPSRPTLQLECDIDMIRQASLDAKLRADHLDRILTSIASIDPKELT